MYLPKKSIRKISIQIKTKNKTMKKKGNNNKICSTQFINEKGNK